MNLIDDNSEQRIRVALRIRPLIDRELAKNAKNIVGVHGYRSVSIETLDFDFDYVYNINQTDSWVFEDAILPHVKNFLSGINVSIIAYGQTGSGKTHTLGLSKDFLNNNIGIIPFAFDEILKFCNGLTGTQLEMSFVEIYMENIRDLLSDNPNDTFVIREGPTGVVEVIGIRKMPIRTKDEISKYLMDGLKRRRTGETNMNRASSRSHAIVTLFLKQASYESKLQLVDLAGSERQDRTNASGERLKEAIKINLGLLSLGNVIRLLSEPGEGREAFVRFRDSKVTRILKDSLAGNSMTLMIACVSCSDDSKTETINTLRYACKASRIHTKAVRNQRFIGSSIDELTENVKKLIKKSKRLRDNDKVRKEKQQIQRDSKQFDNKTDALKSLASLIHLVKSTSFSLDLTNCIRAESDAELKDVPTKVSRRSSSTTSLNNAQRPVLKSLNQPNKFQSPNIKQISKMQKEIQILTNEQSAYKRLRRTQRQNELMRDKLTKSLRGVQTHYDSIKDKLQKEQSELKRMELRYEILKQKDAEQLCQKTDQIDFLERKKVTLTENLRIIDKQISLQHAKLRRLMANDSNNKRRPIFNACHIETNSLLNRLDSLQDVAVILFSTKLYKISATIEKLSQQQNHMFQMIAEREIKISALNDSINLYQNNQRELLKVFERIDVLDLNLIESLCERDDIIREILEHAISSQINLERFVIEFENNR